MSDEKILFDIPASLKEYHNIKFYHELNKYFMFGHLSDDGVKYLGLSIPANAKITTSHDEKIIDIQMGNMLLQLYPLSVMIYHFDGGGFEV